MAKEGAKVDEYTEGEIEEEFKKWRDRMCKKYNLAWHEVEGIVKRWLE